MYTMHRDCSEFDDDLHYEDMCARHIAQDEAIAQQHVEHAQWINSSERLITYEQVARQRARAKLARRAEEREGVRQAEMNATVRRIELEAAVGAEDSAFWDDLRAVRRSEALHITAHETSAWHHHSIPVIR